jgi:hypothetical protein
MTPYQAVLLDWRGVGTLVMVDMDTGTHADLPVEGLTHNPLTIAVDSDGAIYVYQYSYREPFGPGGPFDGSLMARLNPTMSEWMTTIIVDSITFPYDMEFKPDGNLIVVSEFSPFSRLDEINLQARRVQPSGAQFPTGSYGDEGPLSVEIDSSGTITSSAVLRGQQDDTSALFRQAPGAGFADRFDPGIRLSDFVLDSDGSLIGVELRDSTLYRLNFDMRAVDVLFESELLINTTRIELDPAGRIVALTRPPTPRGESSLHRIVRVDLELGTAEVIADLVGYELTDMDLRIIPEPASVVLLALGGIAFAVCRQLVPNVR